MNVGVGIATGMSGSNPVQGKIFLFSTTFRPAPVHTQRPIQWVLGVVSPGVNRPVRETDHSPSSAEVKRGGALYLYSPLCLHAIVLN
jgi:hypothetical protein